ncbi:hypothetical protein SPRG_06330 [Saprolegnia parasitica CBS 223.65]|uniref:Uncharacterized protein n=1 Tax=Saprolegnia parasitica (strain CBS 223.65) TaxID=695850 RepID=A0A067CC00_SAPPC|nr:hypothetical protein SPRG_06330 [Saprolegnia parasitica CBS 223.65]KDO28279.1 hypothetical protein SPRG_06330 [Saprolegnia parasitica CBS 223.65]|eukprot:XP_012201099.1 hypothetical protein SPRG_06330 [Saprolegnia parasitica CBS 223.65]
MKRLFKLPSKYHGVGPVTFAWQPKGNFLATAGKNGLVHIIDRQGVQYDEIGLDMSTPVVALEWDRDGNTLAILQSGNGLIPLWDLSTRSTQNIDTNMKDPSFIKWSSSGIQLAIGTAKGNLVLYNKSTRKLVPILGKHSKKITCGVWNSEDLLVLGAEDRMVTISNAAGDTVQQRELKYAPVECKFGRQKGDPGGPKAPENVVAINVSKSLILLNINDPDNPIELTFQSHYGTIKSFDWFGGGYLMLAFSEGFVICISTQIDEIGEEQFSGRFFSERTYAVCYSAALNRVAMSGESGIKVIDLGNYTEIKGDAVKLSDAEDNEANLMSFTSDGQILTVATQGGIVQTFLARIVNIFDHVGNYVVYLSSLRELTIVDTLGRASPINIQVSIEPSFIAIGPRHVAVGMNNRQQYLGRVTSVKLNREYAAVLSDGKVLLHPIEPTSSNGTEGDSMRLHRRQRGLGAEQSKTFPETHGRDESLQEISSIAITKDFFIFSTANGNGTVQFFYLQEWKLLEGCCYRHDEGIGIVHIAPNTQGTKIVFMDSRRRGYMLNSTNREAIPIPSMPSATSAILWDTMDPTVFVAVETSDFAVFVYSELTINGPEVTQLGTMDIDNNGEYVIKPATTKIPSGHAAILFCDGSLTCQQPGGQLMTVVAGTHDALQKGTTRDSDKAIFKQTLALCRMSNAWKAAVAIESREYWLALASRAMHLLDISLSKRVYRQLGDAGMVLGLDRIEHVEDKNLLAGHVSMLFGQYDQAQKLFLASCDPMAALSMQRYLLQWDQALLLADSLAVHLVPELSASYAAQLEFKGDFDGALKMYEHACNAMDPLGTPVVASEKIQAQCMAGIARCTLRLGDLRRGIRLISDLNDVMLSNEGALILEGLKQFSDAAALYEKGQQYEKAAQIYIQMKQLGKAAPLMAKVTVPKVHAQFAKAKEAMGEFSAASDAYEAANDMDNVVRIQLEHLNSPERAFAIVKATKSSEGASVVAKHCIDTGNYAAAIDFLLMANREEEAFQLAQQHNEIDAFTQIIGEAISADRALKIAQHYEQTQAYARAGEFYQVCGNYHKALRLFLQCGESELGNAIDVVGKARNDMLTHTLIDFLMGDTDGIPKDPNYIFRLYMALGNYAQAAKTAIIIARQEQELGNYKVAHDVLVETHRQLLLHKIHVNQDLRNSLTLLHSYVVVKKLVKRGDHVAAAKMLLRVAKSISKFPTHVSNILISVVIECQRAGLKGSSYEYATMLMRPEYRNSIEKEIKRKIEAIVRRPNKEQPPDNTTPCPFCAHPVIDVDLDCTQCKNWIPYCAVTGYHMVKADWSVCPHCQFPALYSHFTAHLQADPACPMCDKELKPDDITQVQENEVKLSTIELQAPEPTTEKKAAKDTKQGDLFA